jgi:hypothetical protein
MYPGWASISPILRQPIRREFMTMTGIANLPVLFCLFLAAVDTTCRCFLKM